MRSSSSRSLGAYEAEERFRRTSAKMPRVTLAMIHSTMGPPRAAYTKKPSQKTSLTISATTSSCSSHVARFCKIANARITKRLGC